MFRANTRHTVAIFRQINKGVLQINHDALEFPDGEIVLLTRLSEGQRAVGCAWISMMARSTIAPLQRPNTLMQLSRSLLLKLLQHAAGRYILAPCSIGAVAAGTTDSTPASDLMTYRMFRTIR
jgi:hypothetical protein